MKRREFIILIGGAAVGSSLAARAQQSGMPVIGFLSAASAAATPQNIAALREGLADAGFVEGKNVAIELRYADQHLERLPKLSIELVRRQVAVAEAAAAAARTPALGHQDGSFSQPSSTRPCGARCAPLAGKTAVPHQ